MTKVHISGLGGVTGCGDSIEESLANMLAYSDEQTACNPQAFSRLHLDWDQQPLVFEVSPEIIARLAEYQSYHLTSQYALYAALRGIANAGYSLDELLGKRVGVAMGTTIGSSFNSISFYQQYRSYQTGNEQEPTLEAVQRFMRSNPAEVIAGYTKSQGPAQTIVNACASGTDAIGVGASWIKMGLCDVVIAGGCDALSRGTLNGFNSLQIMSSKRCQPFDAHRQGLNLGEGAAVLVLESEKSLKERGAKSRAYISGYGAACDAHHLTAPHPEGRALKQSLAHIHKSHDQSEIKIEPAFVNVHGTATKDNDRVEAVVMADMMPALPYFSSKGATGHTLGAAGAIEAALLVLCLEKSVIPRTIGMDVADSTMPSQPVQENTKVQGNTAFSTSLAFGGLAAALAITL